MSSEQVKVFIVDDSEPALLMLHLFLDNIDNIQVVGSASTEEEFLDKVVQSRADVVICNWHITGRGYAQMKELKTSTKAPAFISIRDGNFLPLEGVMNQTPETLIPTTATCDSLIAAIERSAEKRSIIYTDNTIEAMPLSCAS